MIALLSSGSSSIGLIVCIGLLAVCLGFVMKRMHQPNLVAYILIGVLIGPGCLDLIENEENIKQMGEMGIILLFFFIGMEIDLNYFLKGWRIAVFGTLAQILLSVLVIYVIGYFYDWSTARILVLGMVIALSSSAVIFKLLEEKQLMDKKIGQHVVNILLAQDIAIAPILIMISVIGGKSDEGSNAHWLTLVGGLLFIAVIVYVYIKKEIKWIPFKKEVEKDHELQVFMALFFCFAGALIANLFHISEALGAFIGGLVMHAAKASHWIHDAIHSFRILFVAIFFISIGAQLDLSFITTHWKTLSIVLFAVYATNHLINSCILRFYNDSWKDALLGGALLGQIGELSFLICLSAFNFGLLTTYGYDFTISLISLTIVISPFWILITERILLRVENRETNVR